MNDSGFDIISKTESVDKVVHDFALRLEEYITAMREECEKLGKSLHRLGGEWEGDAYDAFAKKIENKIASIKSAIAKAEEQKKFLDETSEKFHIMLEYLKKASE